MPDDKRTARTLRRLSPGTLGGRSEQAQRLPARPKAQAYQPGAAGGQRFATAVVAPHDASTKSRTGADVVLTGSSDQVALQAVLNEINGTTYGLGRVVILEGHVVLDDALTGHHCAMVGMGGWGGETVFVMTAPGDGAWMMSGFSALQDFAFCCDAGSFDDVLAVEAWHLEGLYGGDINGDGTMVGLGSGLVIAAITNAASAEATSCYFEGEGDGSGGGWTGLKVGSRSRTYGVEIVGCEVGFDVVASATGALIETSAAQSCTRGLLVHSSTSNCGIIGNRFIACGRSGTPAVSLDGTAHNVQANMVRKPVSSAPNYGIQVETGAVNCLVTNNDLLNAGATGPLNDLGTGTITAAGNRS